MPLHIGRIMKTRRLTKRERFELERPEFEEANPISPSQILTVRKLKGGTIIKFDSGFYMKAGVRTKKKDISTTPLTGAKRV